MLFTGKDPVLTTHPDKLLTFDSLTWAKPHPGTRLQWRYQARTVIGQSMWPVKSQLPGETCPGCSVLSVENRSGVSATDEQVWFPQIA